MRHIEPLFKNLTKSKIREMIEYHRGRYNPSAGEENFGISILLNNAFNNLNKKNSDMALENIKEIREKLCKK